MQTFFYLLFYRNVWKCFVFCLCVHFIVFLTYSLHLYTSIRCLCVSIYNKLIKRMFSDNKTSFTLIHSDSRLPLIDSAEKISERIENLYLFWARRSKIVIYWLVNYQYRRTNDLSENGGSDWSLTITDSLKILFFVKTSFLPGLCLI